MSRFSARDLEKMRAEIKSALDAQCAAGTAQRLQTILELASSVEGPSHLSAALRRTLLVIFALVHHQRYGGLIPKQIDRLRDEALLSLQIAGIDRSRSAFGFLYRDLYTVCSKIASDQGSHWEALCEQILADDGPTSIEDISDRAPGAAALSLGLRLYRLGHHHSAMNNFISAIKHGLKGANQRLALLMQQKIHRNMHNPVAAQQILTRILEDDPTDPIAIEAEWDQTLLVTALPQRIDKLRNLVQRRNSRHRDATYLLEQQLWLHVPWQKTQPSGLRSVDALRRVAGSDFSRLRDTVKSLQAIEQSYDRDLSKHLRIRLIADAASKRAHTSFEFEVLCLAALARCAERLKSTALTDALLCEYRARSMQASDGKIQDVLAIFLESNQT